jgi:hypothetical protein
MQLAHERELASVNLTEASTGITDVPRESFH